MNGPDFFDEASLIAAHDEANAFDAVVPPIVQTSLFTFSSYDEMLATYRGEKVRPTYTRGLNPTVRLFEDMLAKLEGAEDAIGFASGMSAISSAVLSFVEPGDRIVAVRHIYPDAFRLFGTLLKRMRVEVAYVDGRDEAAVASALPGAKLFYMESPTSWVMETHEVGALAALAKAQGIPTIIDNSWATPVFQRPLSLGVDMVVHSASKYLGGHSDVVAGVEHTAGLTDRALELGRDVDKTAYMLPYGFYLRAMFYNKKLFQEAGVAEPPKTMDEFVTASEKVAKLPGKYGYCLRGGPGGLNGWVMFGASMAGSNKFFNEDGSSTMNSEGWVKGLTWVVDLYKKGLAPKDSVNWGFNEIVAGFYTGTCAMLDQDPDALIAIAERMKPEDYGIMTMPKGPDGKTFPTIGYAGWSMMAASQNKDLSWKLIETLEGPEGNVEWNKRTGALPVHKSAEKDPFYASEQFKGWFNELEDKDAVPTVMPTYLEEFAFFKDSMVIKTSQQALLGDITPEEMAKQWADYLTKAQQKFLAKK